MIVIINPNSTETMTKAMVETAQAAVPEAEVVGWTSKEGPPAIQGEEDGQAAVPPLLALVAKANASGAKAIIIGCADDTGLAAAQKISACPVLGIGQAGYHMASLIGPRFSVVTTLDVSVPILLGNLAAYGLDKNAGRVRASGVPVLALETERDTAAQKVKAEIETALREDCIDCVVLGCAGMSFLVDDYMDNPEVTVIDGVQAAAKFAMIL